MFFKKKTLVRPDSYQARYTIRPDWWEISKDPEIRAACGITNETDLRSPGNLSELAPNGFDFVEFKDNLSGLRQIWSDYRKTFVDSVTVHGLAFGIKNPGDGLSSIIWPEYRDTIHLASSWGYHELTIGWERRTDFFSHLIDSAAPTPDYGHLLAKFPTAAIVEFLATLDAQDHDGRATFPAEFAAELKKLGLTYSYDDDSWGGHVFSAKLVSLSVQVKTFEGREK